MKIQIWSDIMCPFCYLGDQNLKNAIQEYKGSEPIEVEFKAFQLNPAQEKVENPDNPINYTIKKGLPLERVKASFEYISQEAKNLGLPIDLETAKVVNSLDSLQLLKFAQEKGKYEDVKNDLFRGYFAYGKNLSNKETLLEIAIKNGLDEAEVNNLLKTNGFKSEIEKDREEGISKGLKGVPFFIVDDKFVLSGNQPKENFLNLFEKINPSNLSGDSCDIETGICN